MQSIWSFLSTVVVAAITAGITVWITQVIVSYWQGRKKIEDTKLSIYLSWMPFLAESYARAFHPDAQAHDAKEFLRKKVEILGTMQIMGPSYAVEAVVRFCDLAELGFAKDPEFDATAFHHSFTRLNYLLCCEIHGERPGSEEQLSRAEEAHVLPSRIKPT